MTATQGIVALTVALVGFSADLAAAPPPNLVIVMADDMGWADVAAQGTNKLIKTPNLDAMAAGGMRLTRFYAASPWCSPTRGGLLTGRHPSRYGIYKPQDELPAAELTMAEILVKTGYAAGHFGKWHLGPLNAASPTSPRGQGFTSNFSIYNSYQVRKNDSPGFSRNGGRGETVKGYCEDVIMHEAIAFIQASVEAKRPFLAIINNMAPHSPFEATEWLRARYADQPEKDRDYWGMISAIDDNVGRLRQALRAAGVAEKTLVVFTSDNGAVGPSRAHMPFSGGKGEQWEGGLRVPGLFEWPGRIPPGVSDVPATTCDLMPSVLAAAGVPLPAEARPLDGVNLLGILEGKQKERPPFVLHYLNTREKDPEKLPAGKSGFAVYDGPWKLLTNPTGTELLLFDVVANAREKTDLAGKHPDVVKRLNALREAWWASVRKDPGYLTPAQTLGKKPK